MHKITRKIKKYFGFDAASAVRIGPVLSPRRFMNVAKYFLFRKAHPVRVPYYPLTLMVEVSTVCNLKCPGCERVLYQEDPSTGGLPRENVSLKNLVKLGKVLPYIYSTYFVGGLGEPFLNPEFWDIHHFFKKFGIKTGYFTNATLINEDKVRRTFEERVDSVLISIDSHCKESYEAIKSGSSFEKALNGIRLFSEHKKTFKRMDFQLGLNFIFRSDNYRDILGYLDFAKSLGVDFINASAFIVHVEKERDRSIFMLDDAEKDKIFAQAMRKANQLGIRLRLPNIRPFEGCLCYHLWHGVCIFYNGDVCACPFFRSKRPFYFHADKNRVYEEKRIYNDTILGNYLTQDFFKDIWNGQRAQELRLAELQEQQNFNPCGECYYKYDLH